MTSTRSTPRPMLRRLRRIAVAALAVLLVFVVGLCIFHHVALRTEAADLHPPGTLVDVDGRSIHVLADGDGAGDGPTLVFLSGAATIAPVYDFAPTYQELSGQFRTVVVEKTGYGYSDIADVDRDVDSLVAEVREALRLAGERPPYVLVPHSMSGLEALRWTEKFPEEVAAIIGLDMSTPEGYAQQSQIGITVTAGVGKAATWLGWHRIPGLYPSMSQDGLTDTEQHQQRLLLHRNAGNIAHRREGEHVLHNAQTVGPHAHITVPLLLFSTDGRDLDVDWVQIQRDLAARSDGRLVELDCGHAVHRCAPEQIADEASTFLHDELAER